MIIDNNNNTSNSRTIEDDFWKLGDGSLSHVLLQIEEMVVSRNVFPQDRVVVHPLKDIMV